MTAHAASAELLADAVAAENNPAANVQDRTSTLRITRLRATPVGAKTFVRIDTNHGIHGWGEIQQLPPRVVVTLAESLFELLDGENPTRIEHLWQKLFRAHRNMRGGPVMVNTLSGIDMALWDITGKLWGVPVYRLLGGPTRDKIRLYNTPKAVKGGTGGPHAFSGNPRDVDLFVRYVKGMRERVGPDGAVMFDAHCAMPPPFLIQFANAIQPYDVLFIEEPVVPGNIEAFKRVKQQIRVPLASGERDRTIWEMLPYLQHRCLDILQPDCCNCGGITQMKKIATLAEAYFVPLAPHSIMSEVGVSASFQVVAAIPLFLIHEAQLGGFVMPKELIRSTFALDKDGNAGLPHGPGLGIDIDEAVLARLAADPARRYSWPRRIAPDGSVYDY